MKFTTVFFKNLEVKFGRVNYRIDIRTIAIEQNTSLMAASEVLDTYIQ